jgi:septal ring factor EnvC (AmiA/AmiB activator)
MRGPLILPLLLAVAASATHAQDRTGLAITDSGPTSLAEQRAALADARRQSDAARARSAKLDGDAARADNQAARARAEAAALAARIQQSEADLRGAEARIAIVARLQRDQAARLAVRQQPVVRLTAALQMLARRPAVAALVQPGSIADFVHVRAVLGTVLPAVTQRTAGLRAEIARSRALRAEADAAAGALRVSRTQLSARRTQMAALEGRARLASGQFRADAAQESQRALALGEQARDIVDLMDQLRVAGDVRDRLATLSGPLIRPAQPGAAALPAAEAAAANTGPPAYRLPVVGTLVTGLGEVSASGVRARGLTLAVEAGAQVVAPTGGRVVFAGPYRDYGMIVIIDHGSGWTTLITSLARLSVGIGMTVGQGDPLGVAGAGRPKVTVELRRNGRPVDIVPLTGAA